VFPVAFEMAEREIARENEQVKEISILYAEGLVEIASEQYTVV